MQANYPDMWRRTKDKGPFAIHTSIHLSLQRTFFIYHPLKTFRWNYPELEWCTRYALSPFYPGGSCALPRTQEFKDPLLHGCFTREGKTFKTYVANRKKQCETKTTAKFVTKLVSFTRHPRRWSSYCLAGVFCLIHFDLEEWSAHYRRLDLFKMREIKERWQFKDAQYRSSIITISSLLPCHPHLSLIGSRTSAVGKLADFAKLSTHVQGYHLLRKFLFGLQGEHKIIITIYFTSGRILEKSDCEKSILPNSHQSYISYKYMHSFAALIHTSNSSYLNLSFASRFPCKNKCSPFWKKCKLSSS